MNVHRMLKSLFGIGMLVMASTVYGQSFEIYQKDTINRTDSAGLKQGRWMIFNKAGKNPDYPENALLEELVYKNGLREGLRKTYFSNGKVKSEVNYTNNRPSGLARFYYPNGTISEEGNWVYGGWEGNYKNYYETGPLSQDLSYSYGKKEGLQKLYHPNGQLQTEGTWKDGVPDGLVKEYDENGVLTGEIIYNKGVLNEEESKHFNVPKQEEVEKDPSNNAVTKTNTVIKSNAPDETMGAFKGNGFFKLKNKMGLVAREGVFSNGLLIDGKQFFYSADGILSKTLIYKDGKVSQEILEKK